MQCCRFWARNVKSDTSKDTMAAPRIRTDVQVMFFDTDCGGVVSNIAYLRFIEIARTHLRPNLEIG